MDSDIEIKAKISPLQSECIDELYEFYCSFGITTMEHVISQVIDIGLKSVWTSNQLLRKWVKDNKSFEAPWTVL